MTDGWVSEIIKYAPKLEVFKYVGDKECRRSLRMKTHEYVTRHSTHDVRFYHGFIESGWLFLLVIFPYECLLILLQSNILAGRFAF